MILQSASFQPIRTYRYNPGMKRNPPNDTLPPQPRRHGQTDRQTDRRLAVATPRSA